MKKNFHIIRDVILDMGGTIEEFLPERNYFYIKFSGKKILLERKISITRDSFTGGGLTRFKDLTHKLLLASGLPSPQTECFYNKTFNQSKAKKILSTMKYPIILKDANGSNSIGIFPFILTRTEALRILRKELPRYHSMVAQQMVFGREYRVLVLGEKIIGALEMIPPYVTGDGISNIKKLITIKQKNTESRTKFDDKLIDILKSQKVTLETVLPKKKSIFIKMSSCLAEGGETCDVSDNIHPAITKICVAASKVVGRYLVGIDIICPDITKLPTKKSFHILEINGKPDLYIHYNPSHGQTKNVIKEIIKFMVKLTP